MPSRTPSPRRRRRLACVAGAVVALLAPASAADAAPNASVRVDTVCFDVHNTGDPLPSTLYGRRFTTGRPKPATPAIVLVHGVASSTENWDFLPSYSVARSLARKGFVVIAYDRLGFARSHYDRPKGGELITTPNQRDILHQVVGEVKNGGYTTAAGGSCDGARTPSTMANPTVVIAGHSAGGGIVQGYPGKFHDVAAMVQANYSNHGSGDVVTKQLTEVVLPAIAAGQDYVPFFRTRQECEDFNIYPPGAVQAVVDVACDPANFVLTPAGEWTGIAQLQQENDQFVKATGSIPVLLTYGDHDAAFPATTADADEAYWRANCGCDVTRWNEPQTGHLFMAHTSMPAWVDEVTSWLASRGVRP